MTMRFLWRLLFVFVGIYASLTLLRGFFPPSSARRAAPRRSPLGGRLVQDPICGTYVSEQTAIQAGSEFFCSEECRGKFLARS